MAVITSAIEARNISKYFGSVVSLSDVSLAGYSGEVMCLLGDNGAGKSTLIKILAGVYQPSSGSVFVSGRETVLHSPRHSLDLGVATVYQDLGIVPLMSITRNFFMGREPMKNRFLRIFDFLYGNRVAEEAMKQIGINLNYPEQAAGTLSGGERQSLAIARAIHFGAKVLILDEPTSALGVKEAAIVLQFIVEARNRGIAVIFVTHNVNHAYATGDRFTVLNHGHSMGTFSKSELTRDQLNDMMAGGQDMTALERRLEELIGERKGGSPASPKNS
jgi:simple sugar transport system ATP-binding protein